MTIYIIVLHYKNIEDTKSCLESINGLQKNGLDIKVIVVDNGSKLKAQSAKLKTTAQSLMLITNDNNLGFAGGVNVGVKEALKDKNAAYILILNNDTILPPDLLTELLKTPSDIIAPIIKFKWNNIWKYDFGGKIDWNIGRTYHLESDHLSINQFENKAIDYISGCCMLVKSGVFKKIGLFDEKFFFYFEDTDFCVRAKRVGFNISVNPYVSIYHKLGSSIGRWSNKAIFNNLKSNALFITKHLGLRTPIGYLYLFILTIKIVVDKLLMFKKP